MRRGYVTIPLVVGNIAIMALSIRDDLRARDRIDKADVLSKRAEEQIGQAEELIFQAAKMQKAAQQVVDAAESEAVMLSARCGGRARGI